jgi:hypothetical protein
MEEERTVNRRFPGAPGLARKCQMKNKWRMLYSADYSVFIVDVSKKTPLSAWLFIRKSYPSQSGRISNRENALDDRFAG